MRAADNGQAQRPLLFLLNDLGGGRRRAGGGRLVLLALGAPEFFGVGEDEVHVLVECEHLPRGVSDLSNQHGAEMAAYLAGHLAPIVQGDAHPVVDLARG
jgi:hypothetical protein